MSSSALNGDIMVRKGIFGPFGNAHILVYYPIISYQRIEVYRFGKMYMGRFHCNNGVSGTVLIYIVVSNMVLIVRDKILW